MTVDARRVSHHVELVVVGRNTHVGPRGHLSVTCE